ncbi:hypothetical protein BH23ACT11_BH23ACT11_16940 [soil metagenome]
MARSLQNILIAMLLLPVVATVQAQQPLFQQRYSAGDYGGHPQNWALTQDTGGSIIVANTDGIIVFDGQHWRRQEIPGTVVKSLGRLDNGQIYVGGVGEIGYLRQTALGPLEYLSLSPQVPTGALSGDIWTTSVSGSRVLFQSLSHLILFDRGSLSGVWETQTRYHKGFSAGNRFYVREEGVGLQEVTERGLNTIPGGSRYAERRVHAMFSRDDHLLVVTDDGIEQINSRGHGQSLSPSSDRSLSDARPYNAVILHRGGGINDRLFIATLYGGVFIYDGAGGFLGRLAESAGLTESDVVLNLFVDRQGLLWLTLDNGLLSIDWENRLLLIAAQEGLEGNVYDVVLRNNRLLVATSNGLLFAQVSPGSSGLEGLRFQRQSGIEGQIWRIAPVRGGVLVATSFGLAFLRDSGQVEMISDRHVYTLADFDGAESKFIAGHGDGALLVERQGERWVTSEILPRNSGTVRSVAADWNGTAWLVGDGKKLFRYRPLEAENGYRLESASLPDEYSYPMIFYDLRSFVLSSHKGTFYLNDIDDGKILLESYDNLNTLHQFGERHYSYYILDGSQLFLADGQDISIYRRIDSSYEAITQSLLRRVPLPVRSMGGTLRDRYSWFGGDGYLLLYDHQQTELPHYDYQVSFSSLTARGRAVDNVNGEIARFNYDDRDLFFRFAAPTFLYPDGTRYQFMLEGYDREWSEWTFDQQKEYTNLFEGTYRFRVRALNAQGVQSREAVLEFTIIPPWYRSWWALLLYLVAFTGLVSTIVWIRGLSQRRKAEEERIIGMRLDRMNDRLISANSKLVEADRMKDEFLANTSHELRTPLTAILGFSEILQEEGDDTQREFATHIHKSGERLLTTVDALLDLAKLHADAVEIRPQPFDLVEVVDEVLRKFSVDAVEKGIRLVSEVERSSIPVVMDRSGAERILTNLVSNAIKFTEAGSVEIGLREMHPEVAIVVRDTGCGMAPEVVSTVFSAFHQGMSGETRAYEGSGLGLAIAQRVVRMMGGRLDVESEVDCGSQFIVTLPMIDERAPGTIPVEKNGISQFVRGAEILVMLDPLASEMDLQSTLTGFCTPTVVHSARQCTSRARRFPYDMVAIAANGSGLSPAVAVLRTLRTLPGYGSAPIVILAGPDAEIDATLAAAAGFDGYARYDQGERSVARLVERLMARDYVPEIMI